MINFKVQELCAMTEVIRDKAMRKMGRDMKYMMGTRGKEDIIEFLTYELVKTQVKLEQLSNKLEPNVKAAKKEKAGAATVTETSSPKVEVVEEKKTEAKPIITEKKDEEPRVAGVSDGSSISPSGRE